MSSDKALDYLKLFLFLTLVFFSRATWAFHVLIDPGHGGNDRGAFHFNTKEKQLTLQISEAIKKIIQHEHPQWTISLTRHKDQYISLEKRVELSSSEETAIDLMISVHANSSALSSIEGMEIYFQPDQKNNGDTDLEVIVKDLKSEAKNQLSLAFSQAVQTYWDFSPSIIRRSPFYVVEKTKIPSVLIEVGFLSHPTESEKLRSEDYQRQIAQTIVKAVDDYRKNFAN